MEKGKSGTIKMNNNFDSFDDETFKDGLEVKFNKSLESLSKSQGNIKQNVYFAGPWFDKRSNDLYDVCYKICNHFRENYNFFFPREEINESPLDAFNKNVNNIKDSDIVIALVSKKDVGTAWEIGMAYSMNKKIYLLGYDDSTFLSHTNVMLAFTGKCLTIDNLGNLLRRNIRNCDFVKIENDWDGIE